MIGLVTERKKKHKGRSWYSATLFQRVLLSGLYVSGLVVRQYTVLEPTSTSQAISEEEAMIKDRKGRKKIQRQEIELGGLL